MLEQLKDILVKFTKVNREDITEKSVLTADLGLSSFDVVSIVTEIEDEFDIEIPDKDIRKFVTVGDAVDYIEKRR